MGVCHLMDGRGRGPVACCHRQWGGEGRAAQNSVTVQVRVTSGDHNERTSDQQGVTMAIADHGSEQLPAVSRRSFLSRSTAAGLGIALIGSVDVVFGAGPAQASEARNDGAGQQASGYGPLVQDGARLLSLPAGFSYTIIAESGVTRLESGEPTPSDPDGTASFPLPDGGSVLVNNHEIGGGEPFPV